MAKDRNTIAKRQREIEKKRKAAEKRELRAKKKEQADELSKQSETPSALSPAEQAVLSEFREYLMTPGRMLCFSGPKLEAFNLPLAQLIDKGLLVAERFQGGYSLTKAGFAAMKNGR